MSLSVATDQRAAATTTQQQSRSWLDFAQVSKATINPATPDASAAPMASGSSHSGCVGNYSSVGNDFISWTGNMVGCARGNLHLHTWLERNGSLYSDGARNDCSNTTSCTVASHTWYSRPSSGTWVTVVHGWNSTTGGSNYARLTVAIVP